MAAAPVTDRPRLWRDVVGLVLRETRRRRGERIADVAGRAGVSPQYLSEVERGRKEPSSEVLAAVTGALDLTLVDVLWRVTLVLDGERRRRPATMPGRGAVTRPARDGRPAGPGRDVVRLSAVMVDTAGYPRAPQAGEAGAAVLLAA